MPTYFYWGDDDFAIAQAVAQLRQKTLDPAWESFNYEKILPDQPNAIIQGLNQAMTAPFGMGSRLVWLIDTPLSQRCSEDVLNELERTLPLIPEHSVLLFTAKNKPDGRLKSTKLLQKYAEIQEFSPIPPWKTDLLVKQVRQIAQEMQVNLTPDAIALLAESVGSNTRQLYSELEKLRLHSTNSQQPLDVTTVAALVTATTQNSLQLANAIRQGKTAQALELVADLINQNEASLQIVRTLVNRFRTWLWIKLMIEAGERDEKAIAQAAEVNNFKQVYFLQQDVRPIPLPAFLQTLPLLLELEVSLKRGADELPTLQTKVIELCHLYHK